MGGTVQVACRGSSCIEGAYVVNSSNREQGMNPRITGIAGPLKGMTLAITDDEISVGREPSNKLWAADSAMSRRHCAIAKQEDGRFLLSDMGGRNGTRVNGERIEKYELCHRDQIK